MGVFQQVLHRDCAFHTDEVLYLRNDFSLGCFLAEK